MIEVLFVGDEPSPKNYNPEIAFVGTKSYEVLLGWWRKLYPIGMAVANSHSPKALKEVMYYHGLGYKVIALGNKASNRLNKMGIEHFKLPHPSPRNRKLNDPNFIDLELKKCNDYIRGK